MTDLAAICSLMAQGVSGAIEMTGPGEMLYGVSGRRGWQGAER
jgi:hypothetical protein